MNKTTDIATLLHAASSGDVPALEKLAANGVDLTLRDNAAMRRAVRYGQTRAVQFILQSGVSLEPYAKEFLKNAAQKGDAQTLSVLLEALSRPINEGLLDVALSATIPSGKIQCASILLEAGADVNHSDGTPLITAAAHGSATMVRLLLENGADPTARNSQALFAGVFQRSPECVQLLLAAGANTTAQFGIPLQLALGNGDAETVELLLESGVPLTDPDWIAMAAVEDSLECLLLMLEHDSTLLEHAENITSVAAENAAPRVLHYVLEHCNVSQCVLDIALEQATKKACIESISVLLKHQANAGANNSAAFRLAIAEGRFTIARLLLESGADIAQLAPNAVGQVFSQGEVALTVELLRREANVTQIEFTPFIAARFCREIVPEKLFESISGKTFTKTVRDSRLRFAERTARKAFEYDEIERARITEWLAGVIAASQL